MAWPGACTAKAACYQRTRARGQSTLIFGVWLTKLAAARGPRLRVGGVGVPDAVVDADVGMLGVDVGNWSC